MGLRAEQVGGMRGYALSRCVRQGVGWGGVGGLQGAGGFPHTTPHHTHTPIPSLCGGIGRHALAVPPTWVLSESMVLFGKLGRYCKKNSFPTVTPFTP